MARYDVVKQYDWTSSPRGSGIRRRAPRVWVKSYKLKTNQVLNRITSYVEVAKGLGGGSGDDFYDNLYSDATEPEDDFNFPFFGDTIRSFSNNFGETFQNGFGGGGGIGETLDTSIQTALGIGGQIYSAFGTDAVNEAAAIVSSGASPLEKIKGAASALKTGAKEGGNPGTYIETPKFYQYEENDDALPVSFVLSNTINDDYTKNNDLVKYLTRICRPLRKNAIAMDPPRIFQVRVPGQRFIKWAYCSNFSVNFLGTKREIDGVVTPEAYQVDMAFTSLTVEAANFMDRV